MIEATGPKFCCKAKGQRPKTRPVPRPQVLVSILLKYARVLHAAWDRRRTTLKARHPIVKEASRRVKRRIFPYQARPLHHTNAPALKKRHPVLMFTKVEKGMEGGCMGGERRQKYRRGEGLLHSGFLHSRESGGCLRVMFVVRFPRDASFKEGICCCRGAPLLNRFLLPSPHTCTATQPHSNLARPCPPVHHYAPLRRHLPPLHPPPGPPRRVVSPVPALGLRLLSSGQARRGCGHHHQY